MTPDWYGDYCASLPLSALLEGYESWYAVLNSWVKVPDSVWTTAPGWYMAYRHEIIRRCREDALSGSA